LLSAARTLLPSDEKFGQWVTDNLSVTVDPKTFSRYRTLLPSDNAFGEWLAGKLDPEIAAQLGVVRSHNLTDQITTETLRRYRTLFEAFGEWCSKFEHHMTRVSLWNYRTLFEAFGHLPAALVWRGAGRRFPPICDIPSHPRVNLYSCWIFRLAGWSGACPAWGAAGLFRWCARVG
jgi:hypothetical protein